MDHIPSYIGPNKVIRKLGEGGMGTIFLVQHPVDGTLRAAKVMKTGLNNPFLSQRFRREFRVLKSLNHPGIIQVEELVMDDQENYFLMEYVPGRTLKDEISLNFRKNWDWILQFIGYIADICEPIHHIHSQRMVHRDLKPSNIMVLPPGNTPLVKLLDFGLIFWRDPNCTQTQPNMIMGSMIYVAPEQAIGEAVDPRSDLYSMGIILYEGLTGNAPFYSDNPMVLIGMQQMRNPEPPRNHNPFIPPELDCLILELLSKRPVDRPKSALDIARRLRNLMSSQPIEIRVGDAVPAGGNLFEPTWIGRSDEISAFRNEVNLAITGKIRAVVVYGEAGIGKSRFLLQLERIPELLPRIVCKGTYLEGDSIHRGIFQALQKGISTAKRNMASVDWVLAEDALDRLTKTRIQATNHGSFPPQDLELRDIAGLVLEVLESLSKDHTIILFMEDLHLAGRSDIDLLRAIIQLQALRQEDSNYFGLLLVCTYRIEDMREDHPFWAFQNELAMKDRLVSMPLPRLEPSEMHHFINSMLGGKVESEIIDHIYQESEGIPLYALEIIRKLVENRSIWNSSGMWTRDKDVKTTVPAKITRMISYRLSQLGPECRKLLQAAAILGRMFRGDEHEIMCDMDEDVYLDNLDQILRHRIIEENPDHPDTYRFTHMKFRESILSDISQKRKQILNKKAGNCLLTIYRNRESQVAERLATHLELGGIFEQAYRFRYSAADKCLGMGAHVEAADHLRTAWDDLLRSGLSPELLAPEEKKLSLKLGRLERRLGHTKEARKLLLLSLKSAKDDQDKAGVAEVMNQLGALLGQRGQVWRAIPLLKAALDIFKEMNDVKLQADCLTNLGCSMSIVLRDHESLYYHQLALNLAAESGDQERLIRCHINTALAYLSLDRKDMAMMHAQESLKIARKFKNKRFIAFSLMGMVGLHSSSRMNQSSAEKVLQITSEVIEVVQKTGDQAVLADCLSKRAMAAKVLGLPYDKEINKALAIAQELRIQWLVDSICKFKQNE